MASPSTGPRTKAAVARTSAHSSDGPTTVTDSDVGRGAPAAAGRRCAGRAGRCPRSRRRPRAAAARRAPGPGRPGPRCRSATAAGRRPGRTAMSPPALTLDVAAQAGREVLGGALHRPALDQPGRVEAAPPGCRVAGQVDASNDAAGQRRRPSRTGRPPRPTSGCASSTAQLAAVDPADLAVRAVGREQHVDGTQLVVRRLDPRLRLGRPRSRAAQVDADRHPHHLLDPGAAGGRCGAGGAGGGHRFAWSIADCSDCT